MANTSHSVYRAMLIFFFLFLNGWANESHTRLYIVARIPTGLQYRWAETIKYNICSKKLLLPFHLFQVEWKMCKLIRFLENGSTNSRIVWCLWSRFSSSIKNIGMNGSCCTTSLHFSWRNIENSPQSLQKERWISQTPFNQFASHFHNNDRK